MEDGAHVVFLVRLGNAKRSACGREPEVMRRKKTCLAVGALVKKCSSWSVNPRLYVDLGLPLVALAVRIILHTGACAWLHL